MTFKGSSNISLNSVYSKESLVQFLLNFKELIEPSFDKILEFKIKTVYRLEDSAKVLIFENFVEIISGLCIPKIPSSIADVDDCLKNYCRIPVLMKPNQEQLEILKTVVIKGKKGKLCMPHDKLLNGFKSQYGQCDLSVILYVLAVTEKIVQTYIEVGFDYQTRVSQDQDHLINHSTMQIIFSKYNNREEQQLVPIYTSMNKLTKQFSQNYSENIKNFILFLRDCREQLEILMKVFRTPLETEENLQDVFGSIGNVVENLSLVVDTLDDSTDMYRKFMAMDMMDLAEMELFTPFKNYANEMVINNDRRERIEDLLKSDVVVDKLICHYNSVLGTVFSKCSQKRCNDLMVRYRLLHYCDICRHPHELSRQHKSSFSMSSPIDERRSEDSGYGCSALQFSTNLEHASSSSSSVISSSDSPRVTRGPSPMDLDTNSEERTRSSRHSSGPTRCNLLVNCYRYLLPRLLLLPVFQFLYIFQILDEMSKCQASTAEEKEEMGNLEIVVNMLRGIVFSSKEILSQNANSQTEFTRLQMFFRIGPWSLNNAKNANIKLSDIKNMVKKQPDNWEWPSGGTSEFIMEGPVQMRVNNKKKYVDRYLYLFSNMLLICKKSVKKANLMGGSQVTDLKLKQRISLEQFHIIDDHDRLVLDNEDLYAFTLEYSEKKEGKQSSSTGSSPSPDQKIATLTLPGRHQKSIFGGSSMTLASMQTITDHDSICSHSVERPTSSIAIYLLNPNDKTDWVASLLQLQTKLFSQYVIIKNVDEVPLKLPDVSVYRFAESDNSYNIEYESTSNENSGEVPVIKMATLDKLITHLTYHNYCDGKTLNYFLLIFRNFTTAEELLDILMERFDIPDPQFTDAECRPPRFSEYSYADRSLKKFRTAYKRKMQLRVVNFVTKWINDAHYFKMDFASNPSLLDKLQAFLDKNMVTPHLALKIRTVKKNIDKRRRDSAGFHTRAVSTIEARPPSLAIPLCTSLSQVSVTTVHPLELARQITLFEWRLYSKIEFWEVNGREKQDGPNFSASIEFSNRILYWFIHEIMRHRNLHDRVAAILRIADLMQIFENLNNLQGAQECKGALISASVYRLKDTFDFIAAKHKASYRLLFEKLRNDYQESSDSYIAQYQKKIHNIGSLGLPYIAMGDKTQLIHMNLKNPNYFIRTDPNTGSELKLINFWKFRQMSELIQHYLSFQNTPYNFHEIPLLQTFLGQMDIFKAVTVNNHYEFDDFAHEESLVIQPRFGDSPSFPDRRMSHEEIKMNNSLNNLSIKDKLTDSPTVQPPESPPPLPPKTRNKSNTPEPTLSQGAQLPPSIPERPATSRRESHEPAAFSHSPSTSDPYLPPPRGDGTVTRPPPIPSRSLSRDSKSSPPSIPPRLPPLPPKNSDSV